MAKMSVKSVLLPSLALVVICAVISGALAVTNFYTKDAIKKAQQKASVEAMATIYTDSGLEFDTKEQDGFEYTDVKKDGKTVGYIFSTESNGYGGAVGVMTGIDTDGKIKAIRVLSVDDETPGLGQNAKNNDAFAKQFVGKSKKISTQKNKEIDAITGATITTNAVINSVNEAISRFNIIKGE